MPDLTFRLNQILTERKEKSTARKKLVIFDGVDQNTQHSAYSQALLLCLSAKFSDHNKS